MEKNHHTPSHDNNNMQQMLRQSRSEGAGINRSVRVQDPASTRTSRPVPAQGFCAFGYQQIHRDTQTQMLE